MSSSRGREHIRRGGRAAGRAFRRPEAAELREPEASAERIGLRARVAGR